jgi:hypothetical protein
MVYEGRWARIYRSNLGINGEKVVFHDFQLRAAYKMENYTVRVIAD